MIDGFLTLPWWGYVVVTLVLTQITIAAVTIYLHRAQAHRALALHPLVAHFFRFWLWLTTGMVTKEWVAIHRKHHARCETEEDPHSPQILGINAVLWRGAELYREAAKQEATVKDYGHGTPDDWLERRVYGRHAVLGLGLMLVADVVLFGVYGITMWAVQMIWIPLFAAGVINGLGHYWGYRNFEVADASTNLTNIAFFIGGEELHNNHHAYPSSAKFSSKWWEFDIGWLYIRLMSWLGLAKVKKVAPRPVILRGKTRVDMDTLRAVIVSRMHIMARYAKNVTLPVFKEQLRRADSQYRQLLKQARQALLREDNRVSPVQRRSLERALSQNEALQTVYEYRRRLQALWGRTYSSHEKLLAALQEWCQQAETTGIQVLEDFAQCLKGYALRPV
jgi:stearoyl-CoA desaturase (delta-9 desaturase)